MFLKKKTIIMHQIYIYTHTHTNYYKLTLENRERNNKSTCIIKSTTLFTTIEFASCNVQIIICHLNQLWIWLSLGLLEANSSHITMHDNSCQFKHHKNNNPSNVFNWTKWRVYNNIDMGYYTIGVNPIKHNDSHPNTIKTKT